MREIKATDITKTVRDLCIEANCHLRHGWQLRGAYAMDFGAILGHNAGLQITLSKSGLLKLNNKK